MSNLNTFEDMLTLHGQSAKNQEASLPMDAATPLTCPSGRPSDDINIPLNNPLNILLQDENSYMIKLQKL